MCISAYLGQLALQNKAGFAGTLERSLGRVLADLVDSATLILARVLLVAVENVEDDNAKVVECTVAVAMWQFLTVEIPFNL